MKFYLPQHRAWVIFLALLLLLLVGFTPTAAAQSPCGDSVIVVYGDTLNRIAARCNSTMAAIRQANPSVTNPDRIYIGQRLTIPGQPPTKPDSPPSYIVRPGDTLGRIARHYSTTVSAIVQANPGVTNPHLIYPGQRLVIPNQQESGQPFATISPTSGPPGTAVRLAAGGLPAETGVDIGVGLVDSEYEVVATARTSAEGTLSTQVTIPAYAEANERWVAAVVAVTGPTQIKVISNVFEVTSQPAAGPVIDKVKVFLVALDQGNVGCGDQLLSVERAVAPTRAPLTAAIQALLALDQRTYGQSGLYNALYQSNLQLDRIDLNNGQAIIRLTGELQLGGVCDNPRIEAQLEQTALQFPSVDEVEVVVNGELLEEVLSLR